MTKKIISSIALYLSKIGIFLLFFFIFSTIYPQHPPVPSIPAAGTGTESDPYLIAVLNNLAWLTRTESAWGTDEEPVYIKQTAHIDAATLKQGANFNFGYFPIGNEEVPFIGEYDGQDYIISNLYFWRIREYFGLFGYAKDSSFKNIRLQNIDYNGFGIEEEGQEKIFIGGIIGYGAKSIFISDCSVTGSINVIADIPATIGGIIGKGTFSEITNSYTNIDFSGSAYYAETYIGGIAGISDKIFGCYSTSDIHPFISGNYEHASIGGIAGKANEISNSFSRGYISTRDDFPYYYINYAGGIVGDGSDATISYCYSTGNIYNAMSSGGISGTSNPNTILYNFWDIETTEQIFATPNFTPDTNFGLPTIEMIMAENYIDNGWDFDNIWDIDPIINAGYPYLRNLSAPDLILPVTNLTASVSGNTVRLDWSAPAGSSVTLIGYNIHRNTELLTPSPIQNLWFIDQNVPDGIYTYIVNAYYSNGYSATAHIEVAVNTVNEVEKPALPYMTALHGNYPNPFNPETTISFSLSIASNLRVDIYNIKGQKIKTLINKTLEAGEHNIIWAGTDDNNKSVTSGIYFYVMRAGDFISVKKMSFVK